VIAVGFLNLQAVESGSAGGRIRARVSPSTLSMADARALGVPDGTVLFNLKVTDDRRGGLSEEFFSLSVTGGSRSLAKVLSTSSLVRATDPSPTLVPDFKSTGAAFDTAQQALKTADETTARDEAAIVNLQNASRIALDAVLKDTVDPVTASGERLKWVAGELAATRRIRVGMTPSGAFDAIAKAEWWLTAEVDFRRALLDDAVAAAVAATADSAAPETGDYVGSAADKTGLYALDSIDLFNILCVPPDPADRKVADPVRSAALDYCYKRRAFFVVDPDPAWDASESAVTDLLGNALTKLTGLGLTGEIARNAAVFFPRVKQADPLRGSAIRAVAPCGVIAGIFARTDATRGVWKAPAGLDATLAGIDGLTVKLTDAENGLLNPVGINCLRTFPAGGTVVWGSRTLRGSDQLGDEYKYIPVRRFTLFLEESLYRGTQFAVFEPNDEPLWAQLRLNVGVFMNDLFRQGAFAGRTPAEAYQVKCDAETTTQSDVNKGIVNILVKFAPLKPAEFVVLKIQQLAGNLNI
jgi:phage tail sheath protein FI